MSDPAKASLDGATYLNLATFRRNGNAVETPVWFAERGGLLYVFSAADAGKVKRLRNDPRVRVAACGARGALRGPWIEGTARRVEEPAVVREAYDALRSKYGWQMWLTDALSRLAGRIDRRAILEIRI